MGHMTFLVHDRINNKVSGADTWKNEFKVCFLQTFLTMLQAKHAKEGVVWTIPSILEEAGRDYASEGAALFRALQGVGVSILLQRPKWGSA